MQLFYAIFMQRKSRIKYDKILIKIIVDREKITHASSKLSQKFQIFHSRHVAKIFFTRMFGRGACWEQNSKIERIKSEK